MGAVTAADELHCPVRAFTARMAADLPAPLLFGAGNRIFASAAATASHEYKDSRGGMVDLNAKAAGTMAAAPSPAPVPLTGGVRRLGGIHEQSTQQSTGETAGSRRAAIMTVKERTQVGIVGAGQAGLLLSHLLALGGIESRVVEVRSRAHCEARQRAGMLEPATAQLLRDTGLGRRLDAEGLQHDGIYLQFAGERHHMNFRELAGKGITIYPQTEIVKDLIQARNANSGIAEFGATDTEAAGLGSDRPELRYIDAVGQRHEVSCDVIAGCDGFRGICRPAVPAGSLRTLALRTYPFSWLGILAQAPPSTDQVIYARHDRGFALHSMRTPQIGRLYLQVPADDDISQWPDDRIWDELSLRLAVPGWNLRTGPVLDKGITGMRSFVAAPMRYRRLFLAGDAAHIVPPTGAKGLNLAVADVAVLATALIGLLRYGRTDLADAYSDTCQERAWRATYLSWWMTTMLHVLPRQDPFDSALQIAQLRNLTSSRAAGAMLAEIYTGGAPVRFDPSPKASPAAFLGAGAQVPAWDDSR
jgi:p-hydroxybenzoate 3-monooxygenase